MCNAGQTGLPPSALSTANGSMTVSVSGRYSLQVPVPYSPGAYNAVVTSHKDKFKDYLVLTSAEIMGPASSVSALQLIVWSMLLYAYKTC